MCEGREGSGGVSRALAARGGVWHKLGRVQCEQRLGHHPHLLCERVPVKILRSLLTLTPVETLEEFAWLHRECPKPAWTRRSLQGAPCLLQGSQSLFGHHLREVS